MKAQPITAAEARVLAFICSYSKENGFPPTLKEICTARGFASTMAARYFIGQLQRKGYVIRASGSPRGIRVLRKAGPIVGQGGSSAAGQQATGSGGAA